MSGKHEFALYTPQSLPEVALGQQLTFKDAQLALRLQTILRLKPGERFILFDTTHSLVCELLEIQKKDLINVIVHAKHAHEPFKPFIAFALPLLKKDDFEAALYCLVELGAQEIHLLTTTKTQRTWQGTKEYERVQRIMIAAAEQSKNFALPTLFEPLSLPAFLAKQKKSYQHWLYCDPQGKSLLSVLPGISLHPSDKVMLMVGPEGDLTDDEKKLLSEITFCSLTPTILRSMQAVALSLGICRTFWR